MTDNESSRNSSQGVLPYTDSKSVGAADFYFAINATFRFILNRFGMDGLRQYWTDLGSRYYAPVSAAWRRRGLAAVAAYWKAFFAAEPGAKVEVTASENSVTIDVKVCPAIHHLRKHGRQIVPCFCQHCYYVNEAMARPAGLTVRVSGGNGACEQTFWRQDSGIPPPNIHEIKEAT